jgi:hypothetical protein
MSGNMSEEEYQAIKTGVERRRAEKLEAEMEQIRSAPGTMAFATVDELMAYLDSLPPPEDRPARAEGSG